jgi:hypothetical protein
LEKTAGLWQSIKAVDIDKNGFPDLLVGNWGQNSKLKATEQYPLKLYVGDLDRNGDADQLLAVEKEGNYYAFSNKEDLEKQFPALIRKRYEYFSQMAGQTLHEIFPTELQRMTVLNAHTLSTAVLWNNGAQYHREELPGPLQWFPVFAWAVADFDADGNNDILAAGNFYGVTPYEGKYDAGYGQILLKKNNNWINVLPCNSNLKLVGDVRSVAPIRTTGKRLLYLVARNNDKLMVLEAIKKR